MIASIARPLTLTRANAPVWGFAALLVVWGNAASALLASGAALPGGSPAYALSGVALVTLSLVAARALGLGARALGLRSDALRGARIGVALGLAASLVGVAALRLLVPLIVGQPVDYAPLAGVSGGVMVWHVAVLLPLGVVVPEEVAFRGVLLGAVARARGTGAAVLASSIVFALWHATVVFTTVAATTIGPVSPWSPVAVAGAFVVVAAGGAVLAWLRLRTGSLATTIAAHWTFNVVVLVGLWWTR